MDVLGVDPDLHRIGWAVVTESAMTATKEGASKFRVKKVGVLTISAKLTGQDAVIAMRDVIHRFFPQKHDARNPGFDLAVVEGQEIYFAKAKSRHNDILALAQVAGLCMSGTYPSELLVPRPSSWKGQVPKQIHQSRILSKLTDDWRWSSKGNQKSGYQEVLRHPRGIVEESSFTILPSDWKHVTDAIGLACWGIIRSNRLHQISSAVRQASR